MSASCHDEGPCAVCDGSGTTWEYLYRSVDKELVRARAEISALRTKNSNLKEALLNALSVTHPLTKSVTIP